MPDLNGRAGAGPSWPRTLSAERGIALRMFRCPPAGPYRTEVQQEDGRVRYWIHVAELGRWLRVVTLADGITLHNAFPDRRFKP